MRTVFTGGTVVSPEGDMTVADVVVEEGRFLDIGTGLDADEAIDVSGKHLLPGLFDAHTHIWASSIDFLARAREPFSLGFYKAIGSLRSTLECGITTIRDAGGADLGIKQAVEQGLVPGPRMQISIGMLSQTGGHGDKRLRGGGSLPSLRMPTSPNTLVDGPEDVRVAVRELVKAGADVLKVATSGGVLSPDDDPKHPHFQPDELDMMRRETQAAGIYMMAHAQGAEGIKNAIRADFRSIDHGIYLDDEAIEMMLEKGTWLVPTLLAPRGVLQAADRGIPVSPSSLEKSREVIGHHDESVRRAIEAGVRIAMGTDCPVSPHGTNLGELEVMVGQGMTPQAALHSATQSAADLMGLGADLGSIAPGKIADLVVVDGDPFDFGSLKGNITQVWKAGEQVV